jgi:hypothetical protein
VYGVNLTNNMGLFINVTTTNISWPSFLHLTDKETSVHPVHKFDWCTRYVLDVNFPRSWRMKILSGVCWARL